MRFANLNGNLLPADALVIKSSNSVLRYGFGLFETMLVQEGQVLLDSYHWERLFEGMRQLAFTIPAHFTPVYLQEEIRKTLRKNGLEKLCRLRLQVFTDKEHLFMKEETLPGFLIECFSLEIETTLWNEQGWICGIAQNLYKPADAFSGLKTCAALPYAIAAQQAIAHGWDDALILNPQHRIIESAIANIFWVKDQQFYTTPVSEGCIAGVMRRHLLTECARVGMPVQETPLTQKELHQADEVVLTNAIRRMKWVNEIAGSVYSHSFTRELYNRLF